MRLISLQKGAGTEQIRALGGRFPVAELDGGIEGLEDRRDFLDTAAVMSLLDLVVTPETAVAHLAGALGVQMLGRSLPRRRLAMDGRRRPIPLVSPVATVPADHDGQSGTTSSSG